MSDIAIDDVAILQGDECTPKNESTTSVTVGDDGKLIFQIDPYPRLGILRLKYPTIIL